MTWHGPTELAAPKAPSMIKSGLVQKLASQSPHLYQRDLERIVKIVLDKITGALQKGGPRQAKRLWSIHREGAYCTHGPCPA